MTKQDAKWLVDCVEDFIEQKIDVRLSDKYRSISADRERDALIACLSSIDFNGKD